MYYVDSLVGGLFEWRFSKFICWSFSFVCYFFFYIVRFGVVFNFWNWFDFVKGINLGCWFLRLRIIEGGVLWWLVLYD